MTVIDFDFDQRDPDRAQLQEIAVVARGMTSGNTRYDLEVMADSPSAYWRLNDASAATTAADNTANAQTGTYVGAPTKQQTGPLLGDPNKAVLLNGSTQYITVPDNALLDPGDVFTLECWVKPNTSAGTTHTIFSKGANGYLVTLQNTLGTILVMLSKESVGLIAQNLSSLTNGVWTHIAVTKNGSAIHIYINGADSTTVILNRTIAGTASALNMGRTISTTADFFNGTIDEMAIYPTALSAARILVHYNNGTEPIFLENPVTVLYQFMTQFFGFAAASLKVNLWVSEALKAEANTVSAVSTPLRAGFVLTEATMTQQDLLLEFQVSFLLSVYSTRSNLYAPYIYTSASSTQSADFQVTDKYDILRDSLMVPSNQQFMSAIQINRLFSPLKNAYLVSPLAPTDLRGTLGTAVVKDYIPLVLNERLIGDDLAGVSTSMTYRYSELMGPAVQFPSVKFPLSCVNRDLIYALQVLRDIPSVLYRMNDVTSTMLDSSGNNYSGSFLFCTNGQTGPLLEDSNTSTLFNGSTSNALVLDSSLIDLGDVCTCEVWVYPTDLSTSPYIIDKGANAYGVQIGSSGIISFVKSGAAVLAFSTVAVQINQWSHICCTKNGTDVHVYLNGVDVSDVTSTSTLADNAVNLELGMSVGGTSHFAGNMANVALYNTAIGADRVYQHYASGVLVFGSNMYDLIDVNTVLGVTHWRARKFNHTGSPTYSVVYSGQTVRVLRISMDLSPENPTMQVTGITNMLSNGA
jgi:hypothetical protein